LTSVHSLRSSTVLLGMLHLHNFGSRFADPFLDVINFNIVEDVPIISSAFGTRAITGDVALLKLLSKVCRQVITKLLRRFAMNVSFTRLLRPWRSHTVASIRSNFILHAPDEV